MYFCCFTSKEKREKQTKNIFTARIFNVNLFVYLGLLFCIYNGKKIILSLFLLILWSHSVSLYWYLCYFLFRCSNCNPVNVNANVNLQLQCEGCQEIVWYFEDKSHVPVSAFILSVITPYLYSNIVTYVLLFSLLLGCFEFLLFWNRAESPDKTEGRCQFFYNREWNSSQCTAEHKRRCVRWVSLSFFLWISLRIYKWKLTIVNEVCINVFILF